MQQTKTFYYRVLRNLRNVSTNCDLDLWAPNCSWVTHKATKFLKVWRFKVNLIHPLWQPSWWLNDNCKTRYYIEPDKNSRNLTQVVQCQIKEVLHNSAFPLSFNPKHVFKSSWANINFCWWMRCRQTCDLRLSLTWGISLLALSRFTHLYNSII